MTIQQNYPNIRPSMSIDFANTKQLDPRITYSRASTGTYYDGKTVAKAEENLLLWSQEFQNTGWLRSGAAIAADTSIAPDGTTTADTLTASAGSNSHLTQRSASVVANQNYTYTIYAKYATAQYIAFGFASGALGSVWAFVTVDIQNGTITQTTNGSNLSSTALGAVTSVGNGWYRITVTGSHSQTDTYPTIHIVNTSTPSFSNYGAFTWTAAGTETVLLWGAQLEQRSFATAYTPTTTAPITNYIPVLQTASAGTPRFDHNPITGESLGLLIEEQRTNLVTYSEQFDNAAWTKASSAIIANAVFSPDGTLDADKLVENATNNAHYVGLNVGTVGNPEVFSFYAKAAERTWCAVQIGSSGVAYYDLQNGALGTVTNSTASIVSVGNGWFRCSISATRAVNTNNLIYSATANNTVSYTGNGFSGVYIWGAQLEAGAFATSYIPTVASQVTRAVDSASMTGTNFSSWYNQGEGTVYTDVSRLTLNGSSQFNISDGTNSNYIQSVSSAGGTNEQAIITSGGTLSFNYGPSAALSAKLAMAYKTNDSAGSLNGAAATTDTSVTIPAVNQLSIGNSALNNRLNGTIKKLAYYPRRLTNTQIQALTT